MNTIEILNQYYINRNKISLSSDLNLIIDIIKEDILQISRSKRLYFKDFDFTYSESVKILKQQLSKKHLRGIKRFLGCKSIENSIRWLISRLLNNMRNLTTNRKYLMFCNPAIIEMNKKIYYENHNFHNMINNLELQKLDKITIKNGLIKLWKESEYDKEFDYLDFVDLCNKFGFEADKVVVSDTFAQIKFKKYKVDKYYQLELII